MLIEPVAGLGPDVIAVFTGRDDAAPGEGNLAHRRPHRPAELATARATLAARIGVPVASWHLMHQVHGNEVAEVGPGTPLGAELRGVDAAVTACRDRALVVQAADCVPVLLAGPGTIGVAHAGRVGVASDVIGAAVAALRALEEPRAPLRSAIGPAIGPCCYEVPGALQDEVAGLVGDEVRATTSDGAPSLDLPGQVARRLGALGIEVVADERTCTSCDQRWFSHRRDPAAGRQIGLIARRDAERAA